MRLKGILCTLNFFPMYFWLKAGAAAMMLMVCHSAAHSQDGNCSHRLIIQIKDGKSAQIIEGALVSAGDRQTFSDEQGYCIFDSLCQGNIHLHIQTMDAVSETDIDFTGTKDTFIVKTNAQTQGVTLDDVEVRGHKTAIQTVNAVQTLNKAQLQQVQGGSLAAQLQSIPGVSMLQTGGTIAKPVINGMYGNRVLILNNGVRQQGQQWGAEHAPELDPYIANQLTVVKGAESVRYGADAIGGVIIVDPPVLPDDGKIHSQLSLMGATNGRQGAASAELSGNMKKLPAFAWRVQGTAKQGGNLKAADYYLNNTGVKEYNYSAAAAYTKKHFDANIYYSHFNTQLGILKDFGKDAGFRYDIAAPRQHVIHDLLKIQAHQHLNDNWHLTAQYAYQHDRREEYDIRRGGKTSLPSLNLGLSTQTADLTLEHLSSGGWQLTGGWSGMYQNNASVPGTMIAPLIPDYVLKTTGIYGILRYQSAKYALEAGLRYDYLYLSALGYDKNNQLYGGKKSYNSITGNIGAVWYISNDWNLRSNVGTAWRPPSVNELYSNGLHHGALSYELGDSTMQVEKSYKWISTLSYTHPAGWLQLQADGYIQYFNGYIYLNPMDSIIESIRGSFPYFQYEQTNARFIGTDITLQLRILKQLEYKATASLIRAKNLRDNSFLPMIPSDKYLQELQWHLKDYSFLKNSFIKISHQFVAMQKRYEPGSDYAPPPSAYHLLGIGAGTSMQIGRQQLKVFVNIDNLLNQSYRDYMNRYRYYTDDMGRNIQLRLIYAI